MRKALLSALLAICASAAAARGDQETRDRLSLYFREWFSVCPGTRVTVEVDRELTIPGLGAYKVERHCELKTREAHKDRQQVRAFPDFARAAGMRIGFSKAEAGRRQLVYGAVLWSGPAPGLRQPCAAALRRVI